MVRWQLRAILTEKMVRNRKFASSNSFKLIFISIAKSYVNTQVVFDRDEFEGYEIEREGDITFCLKEFKVFF